MSPGPVLLKPKERENEEERELEKQRERLYKRQNPNATPAAAREKVREAAAQPPAKTSVKSVEEVPVVAPPKMSTPSAGPAHAFVEQNVRQEVKKVEKFAFTTRNEETGQQQVSVGQSELIYDEHKKSGHDSFERQGGAEIEKEGERGQIEQRREQMQRSGQIVEAQPMAREQPFESLMKEKEKQEAELVRSKEMLKLDKVLPAEVVGAQEKKLEEERKVPAQPLKIEEAVKAALDEALEHNRPALVVSAVLQKEQKEQFELSLLSVDEKRLEALLREINLRLRDGQIERMRLAGMMVNEQDAAKKRQLKLKMKKLQLSLAFYTRVKGMLGRLLGGFFGKLAGLSRLFK